ncbi:hypothetical protein MRB53_015165 [Persea americana]|uniref:Uncharacterized protein n=1 Tax=Persea americana TaxID=3435 RepID=A0ACC2KD00_PERAE|nr:hypothetical protein MRB53_015165 [Persea americana]
MTTGLCWQSRRSLDCVMAGRGWPGADRCGERERRRKREESLREGKMGLRGDHSVFPVARWTSPCLCGNERWGWEGIAPSPPVIIWPAMERGRDEGRGVLCID